jgi:hypothetical protein
MACDPVFNTIVPLAQIIQKDNNNQVTGVCWARQQKIYLDAENAPLPYGKKTYFYGKTYSGTLEIKLDYQSSVIFPGLVSEVDVTNKTLKKIYVSGGANYPELEGFYDHVLDANCAPYGTYWKHSTKNTFFAKILLSSDNYTKCNFKAWTGRNNVNNLVPGAGDFENHYWQGSTGNSSQNNKFDKYSLPHEIAFSETVRVAPMENVLNLKINQNRFLVVKSGNFPEQIINRSEALFSYRLGVEDIAAFDLDIVAMNLGQIAADISVSHRQRNIGQIHRFLEVGGIYYQDIDSIYGKRYAKRGSLDISNQKPIWSLTGAPSNEVKANFELMWYNDIAETKFSPVNCQNPSLIDQNHPKYQPKVLNIKNDFVKFNSNNTCGRGCPPGQSSCSLSLNWASSSSLSRSPNEDGNFNDPILSTNPPPSVYETVNPNPKFLLPNENDVLEDFIPPEPPTPPGNEECPFPFVCEPPPSDPEDTEPRSSTSLETQCFDTAFELRQAQCQCNRDRLGPLRFSTLDPRSEGNRRASISQFLFIKKSSSSTYAKNSINSTIDKILNKNSLI